MDRKKDTKCIQEWIWREYYYLLKIPFVIPYYVSYVMLITFENEYLMF